MNKPVSPLEAAMLALRAACPPTGVIHIGAGHGRGAVHAWRSWNIENAMLVEADGARFGWAHELAGQLAGWHAIEAVVAVAEHDVTYYTATNPDEDGLVQPESLAQLWPNLRSVRNEKKTALTLDSLVAQLPHAEHLNWLIIDCYGTGQILDGAQAALGHADVVVLRSVQDSALAASGYGQQADLARAAGLEALPFFESTHPLSGHAIFVRQTPLVVQARQNKLAEGERTARKKADALAARMAELETTHGGAVGDLNQQLAGAQAEKHALIEERDQLLLGAGKRKKELKQLNEQNASLDAALSSSQAKLAQCERAQQAAHAKSNVALAAAYEELRDLRAKLDHSGAQLAQALATLAEAEQLRDAQAADIAALRTETERRGTTAAQLTIELEALSNKHATLQADMDSAATAHRQDMDVARGNLDELRQQLEHSAQTISALTEERDGLAQTASKHKGKISELEQAGQDLTDKLTQQAQQHSALEQELQERRQQLEQCAQTIAALTDERDGLVQTASKRKGKISELEQAGQDLTNKLAQQAQQHSALEQELQAQLTRAAQSEQAKAKLARELEELRPASQARQEEAERLARQLSECKAQSKQAEAEFTRKLGRMAELESENQRARHQHSLLQDELIKGEAQIELIKDLLLRDAGL